jgi:hypothetical protein
MLTAISVIAAAALLVSCGSGGWTEVAQDGGKFIVSMPGRPSERVKEVDLPLGHLKLVNYTITTNEITFDVGYTDYPDTVISKRSTDDVLDLGLDKMFSAYPDGLKQSNKVELQGFPGRSFSIKDPRTGYSTIGKSCMVAHRVYVIQAVMPSRLADRKEVGRFIGSFRLAPVPR